jgi:hypothetical protein
MCQLCAETAAAAVTAGSVLLIYRHKIHHLFARISCGLSAIRARLLASRAS